MDAYTFDNLINNRRYPVTELGGGKYATEAPSVGEVKSKDLTKFSIQGNNVLLRGMYLDYCGQEN